MSSETLGAILEALSRIQEQLASIRVHTWHDKENSHFALLSALTAADGRYSEPRRLGRHYGQVYSQHGEDGVLAEIFRRVGEGSRVFVEIGVGNGTENTTRLLLEAGWKGVWIEAEAGATAASRTFADYIFQRDLIVVPAFVAAENINEILDAAGVPEQIDLLSLDIDFNTSHIWRTINRRARVVCVEYNASIPPSVPLEVPYDPSGVWDGTNWFGAGLKVIEQLGRSKGMALVGCDVIGGNAYLVAEDEVQDRFCPPFTAENHYELPKYPLVRHFGHLPSQESRRWVRHDAPLPL